MGHKVTITNEKPDVGEITDLYACQIQELAEIRYPGQNPAELEEQVKSITAKVKPSYVAFSWRKGVLKCVPENEFIEIKTNRNKDLINSEEQAMLYNLKIAMAGMSVGSSLLYGLVGSGIGNHFILSDDDKFSTSNLNRVQTTVFSIGQSKVETAMKQALEMNPFLRVDAMSDRVAATNMDVFTEQGTVNILFEEIDDFKAKITLRKFAKDKRIPLIMLTNLTDNVMIDVERYDIGSTDIFNGLISNDLLDKMEAGSLTDEDMKNISIQLVDKELLNERAISTVAQIGEKYVGRPQLYGTVALDGGLAPYLLRKLFVDKDLPGGRYSLRLEDIFSK